MARDGALTGPPGSASRAPVARTISCALHGPCSAVIAPPWARLGRSATPSGPGQSEGARGRAARHPRDASKCCGAAVDPTARVLGAILGDGPDGQLAPRRRMEEQRHDDGAPLARESEPMDATSKGQQVRRGTCVPWAAVAGRSVTDGSVRAIMLRLHTLLRNLCESVPSLHTLCASRWAGRSAGPWRR